MAHKSIILFANTAWYLYNFRLGLAKKLKDEGYNVVLAAPFDTYVERLRSEGFEVCVVNMNRRSMNPFLEIATLLSLYKLFVNYKPSAVFNLTIKCVIYGSVAASFARVKSRINAVAGLGLIYSDHRFKYRCLRFVISGLLKISMRGNGTRLIVQNQDDGKLLLDKGIVTADKLFMIKGSGVDGEQFSQRQRTNKESKRIKVLFAARLLWAKGVGDLMEIADQFTDSIDFVIAGTLDPGNPDSVAQDDLDRWDSMSNVSFLGHVDCMPDLLDSIDIVALPSVYGEGVPRILIEAAASGLPLIAYDVPGSREIVVDQVNGLLLPPKSLESLVAALEYLAKESAERERMGKESRSHFLAEYEASSVYEKTIDVIASSLDLTENRVRDACH